MNSENYKNKAFTRAAKLLQTKEINQVIHSLCLLTKEQNPEINNNLLESLVFENIIQFYDDRLLDFYWYSYKNYLATETTHFQQAA